MTNPPPLPLSPSLLLSLQQVSWEYLEPHSQERLPGPKHQHMWSQSLYILCGLLQDGLLNIGEIDPLNRRLSMMPQADPLVQSKPLLISDSGFTRNYLSPLSSFLYTNSLPLLLPLSSASLSASCAAVRGH